MRYNANPNTACEFGVSTTYELDLVASLVSMKAAEKRQKLLMRLEALAAVVWIIAGLLVWVAIVRLN